MSDCHYKENRKRKSYPLDYYLAAKTSSQGSLDKRLRSENQSTRSGYQNEHDTRDHFDHSSHKSRKAARSPSAEDISDSEFPDYLANFGNRDQRYFSSNGRDYDEGPKFRRPPASGNVQKHSLYSSHRSPSPKSPGRPSRIVLMSSTDLPVASSSSHSYPHDRDQRRSRSHEEGEYFEVKSSKSRGRMPHLESEKYPKRKSKDESLSSKKVSSRRHTDPSRVSKPKHDDDERDWDLSQYPQPSSSRTRDEKAERFRSARDEKDVFAPRSRTTMTRKDPDVEVNHSRSKKSRHEFKGHTREYFSEEDYNDEMEGYKEERRLSYKSSQSRHQDVMESRYPEGYYDERVKKEEGWSSHRKSRDDKKDKRIGHRHTKEDLDTPSGFKTKKRESHYDDRDKLRESKSDRGTRHGDHDQDNHRRHRHESRTPPRQRHSYHRRSDEGQNQRDHDRRERAKVEFNYNMWTKGGELRPNHLQEVEQSKDLALPDSTSGPLAADEMANFDDLYAMTDSLQAKSNYLASLSKDEESEKDGSKNLFERPMSNETQNKAETNKVEVYKPLTSQIVRSKCRVQCLDRKFLSHLSEMHPTSALHELCTRLEWPAPEMSLAFEFGPPTGKMYIFKAVINGQSYQPAIAVENKKDAKANCAWFALQEMGFVKKDAGNPL